MTEPMLFRLRVRYVKEGRLRYLGHLEVAHTIERVVRRAGLPYAVTQGFSPHMRVGYSSALPVGTASTCEWYDLFLTEYVPAPVALERLQRATPRDLRPVEALYVDVRSAALTAYLTRATYRIDIWWSDGAIFDLDKVCFDLGEIKARGSIPYARGKKSKVLDLDKTLSSFEVLEASDPRRFTIMLDTRMDNEGAMRPEILLAALDHSLRNVSADEAIISTGMTSYDTFKRIEIARVSQSGDDQK